MCFKYYLKKLCFEEVMFIKSRIPIIIAGPTASGKSSLAVALAKKIQGIIINADSGQLYAGLDILTAQPSFADQQQIPHVLYANWLLNENASAPLWAKKATLEIQQAFSQDKQPILVGGTGFYLKTLLEGFPDIPQVPKEIRADAILTREKMGEEGFFKELKTRDSTLAPHLRPEDSQRIIRAWEILEFTGQTLSWWQKQPPNRFIDKAIVICLMPSREVLHENIKKRFDVMLKQGVLEEVENFLALNLPDDTGAMKAIGLNEIKGYLNGEYSLGVMKDLVVIATRQYAKRQRTWFRHQITLHIVYENLPESINTVIENLTKYNDK